MNETGKYELYIIMLVPVLLSIFFKNPLLLLLSAFVLALGVYRGIFKFPNYRFNFRRGSQRDQIYVNKDVLILDKEFISFVIIDDVPFDYRDLSDSSLRSTINAFHKVTNLSSQIDIIFRKKYIDQRVYTERLLNRIQNLRIIIENDPSNAKAKNEIEILQSILTRLEQGEKPFSYQIALLVHGKSEQEAKSLAEILIRGLGSLNIKSRLATEKEIRDIILLSRCKCRKEGLPSQIPFLTPFSIEKMPKPDKWSEGIYIGRDLEKGIPIFWNIESSENPHLLIIGPTGSGKTELLLSLGQLIALNYGIPVIFFDVKGDIKSRLIKNGYNFKIINPFLHSLNLSKLTYVSSSVKPLFLEKVIGFSFKLSREERAIIYSVLNRYLRINDSSISWRDLISDEEVWERYPLRRALEVISLFDTGGPFILDSIVNGLNVIDLTQIKDESLRRFIIYTVISELYVKYSDIVDQGIRLALIVDEAWTILKDEDEYGIVGDLVKRGRGHGISLLMATQNVQDLGENADVFMGNVGVLCFMNNGDKEYGRSIVKRYSNILDSDVEDKLTFMGRGEMLIRFLGDPRPILVQHNPLTRGSLQD
ncbi:MAG: DNA import protein CedB [Metallosphaera sp.]